MQHREVLRVGQPFFSDSDILRIGSDIANILKSGWLTAGPYVEALEHKFSSSIGTKHAIAVNSGTAALHTILASTGLSGGGEIVVPANTFASSANAALYIGARVRLADCNLDTFNVDATTLESSLTSKTKIAMVTHVGGNPCEMDEIRILCKEKKVKLVEDAAHAIGAAYRNRPCGSFGVANAFSLYPTKVITSAEGGMITTDSDQTNIFARTFRNVGRKALGHGPITMLGCNYRMSDVHAAIGLSQLASLEEFVEHRNRLAKVYDEYINKIDWLIRQQVSRHSKSSYYTYMIRLARGNRVQRDRLMARLSRKKIETTVMFKPIQEQPYSRGRVDVPRGLKNSELVGATSIALPMHVGMNEDDVGYVVKALKEEG